MESFLALIQPLLSLDIELWQPVVQSAVSENLAMALENGKVLALPNLPFALSAREQTFLSPSWLSGKRKNISLEGEQVGGAAGSADEMAALATMIRRYREQATSLVTCMFPDYTSQLKPARTSFRPGLVQGNPSSWRKDDSRLHVDAFPSRPNRGERILRVFTNVNPHGVPRVWRVGEPFEAAARRFLPRIPRPVPGSARLLQALRITKTSRSEYDHIMLHLHDKLKADMDYQKHAPQQEIQFRPGTTWICFSDQVLHAAMSGQFMFEQTFYLPIAAQYHPELSPLKLLENIKGHALV